MLSQIGEFLSQAGHWLSIRGPLFAKNAVEVFIIFLLVYAFLRLMQGTRGFGVLKGLAIFVALLALVVIVISRAFRLETVTWVITSLMPLIVIPLFILFQPEVRRALIRLGQNPLFGVFFRSRGQFIDELIEAVFGMARNKVGALIAIEREVGLSSYVEGGVPLDGEVSAELLKTIFWPGTPLHDGAVVIRQERIAAAGCLFPLTDNPQFTSELGTRHKAGIGITEESDAVVIIVSEQTGRVSLAARGGLQEDIGEKALRRALEEIAAESLQQE